MVRHSRLRQVRYRARSRYAHCRGQGMAWAKVKRGAVLYVALERKQVVQRRAIAYRERHAIADIPFALIGGVFDLRTPQAVAALIDTCKQVEAETGEDVALIVIDTISRALAGGDENTPKDMGAIVAATSKLQAETKAHVLWVHHMPQDGAESLRGHGALLGAMDTTVHVQGGVKTASVVKANDTEEGESSLHSGMHHDRPGHNCPCSRPG